VTSTKKRSLSIGKQNLKLTNPGEIVVASFNLNHTKETETLHYGPSNLSLATRRRTIASSDSLRLAPLTTREAAYNDNLARWRDLSRHASTPNPFFEDWYLLPSLEAFDFEGQVKILTVQLAERWIGLLPVTASRRYYGKPLGHLSTWAHPNSFLGAPLVESGYEHAFWRALLEWADSTGSRELFLHLLAMPLGSKLYEALHDVVAEGQRCSGVVWRETRAMLASPVPAEAYLTASLTGKKRKELRRQALRLAEVGELSFERRQDGKALEKWVEEFLVLEAAGWKGEEGSALACSEQTTNLFRQAMAGAAQGGKLERLSLRLDGQPIAMLINFLTPPGSFSYKTAFDENYARFSPGVLLQMENLTLLEHPGIEWCDSCASADHPMINHIWRERCDIGHLSIAIGTKWRRMIFRAWLWLEMRGRPNGMSL